MSIIFTIMTLWYSETPLQWNKSYKKLHTFLCHIRIYCILPVWHMVNTTLFGNVGLRTLILCCASQGFWRMSAGQRITYHYSRYPCLYSQPNPHKAHKNSMFPNLTWHTPLLRDSSVDDTHHGGNLCISWDLTFFWRLLSSGVWRCAVWYNSTNVSEKPSAFITTDVEDSRLLYLALSLPDYTALQPTRQ